VTSISMEGPFRIKASPARSKPPSSPSFAMSNTSNQKALVYNICQFLKTSLDNGSISSDDAEGIQVAGE
jgi:hypothetical protein